MVQLSAAGTGKEKRTQKTKTAEAHRVCGVAGLWNCPARVRGYKVGCVVYLKDTGYCSAWTTFHRCCCCSTGFAVLGRRSRRKTEETTPYFRGDFCVQHCVCDFCVPHCMCVCVCVFVGFYTCIYLFSKIVTAEAMTHHTFGQHRFRSPK